MMERIFVDTGAWYAYINARDPDHLRVKEVLQTFTGQLITSTYIFDEIVTLTLSRLGHHSAVKVGNTLLNPNAVYLVRVTASDEKAAWDLFNQRPDKDYSFTDCTSFVLMERLKLTKALAVDAHFAQEGFHLPFLDT
jgi:predicted nucleic acid-binding protein